MTCAYVCPTSRKHVLKVFKDTLNTHAHSLTLTHSQAAVIKDCNHHWNILLGKKKNSLFKVITHTCHIILCLKDYLALYK